MGGMDVNSKLTLDSSNFDANMKKSEAAANATARAAAKAAKDAAAAQGFAAKFVGDAVTEQSRRILAAQKAESTAAADFKRVQADVAKGRLSGVEAANAEAAALQRLTAAKIASAGASRIEVAAEHVVSERMAASAVVRGLESGNVGIRSVENFLTTIPGVGAALKAVFPIIGAAAFLAVIGEMGGKLYEIEQKGKHAGDEISRAFVEMNTKLSMSSDELKLATSRIDDANGKLSGHPTDGMTTALLAAAVAADKLQVSLAGDVKELQNLLKEHSVSAFEGFLSGVSPTGRAEKDIDALAKAVERQSNAARSAERKALTAAGGDHAKQEAATREYYGKMDSIAADAARTMRSRATEVAQAQKEMDAKAGMQGMGTVDMTPLRSAYENTAEVYDNLQGRAQDAGANFQSEKKHGELEGEKSSREQAKKTAEAQFKAMEHHVDEWKTLAPVNAKAIHDYWVSQVSVFGKGAEDFKDRVVAKISELDTEGARKAAEVIERFKASQKSIQSEASKLAMASDPLAKWRREDARTNAEKYDASNEASAQDARNRAQLAAAQVQEASGKTMTRYAAAAAMATIHTREYGAELDRLVAKREAIARDPSFKSEGHEAEQARQVADLEQRIAQVRAGRQVQIQQDAYSIQPSDTSALVGGKDALEEFVLSTRDAAKHMHDIVSGTLNSVNQVLTTELTSRSRQGRRYLWTNLGRGLASDTASGSLRKGEAALLSMTGLGPKKGPSGAAGDPLHVIQANNAAGVAALRNIADPGLPAGKNGKFLSFLTGLIPGFAGGVEGFTGGWAMVGEAGPELLRLPAGSSVTPNHKIGSAFGAASGDLHLAIDARGSQDPAQTRAHVNRGVMAAAPHIVAASQHASMQRAMRRPSSSR